MSLNVENTLIASGSSDGTVRIWDLKSGKNEAVLHENLNTNKKGITGVKFSPSPIPEIRYLAALNEDGFCLIYKWNRETSEFYKKPVILDGKQTRGDNISSLTFNKSGSMLAFSTKNGYIHIISFITGANKDNCSLLKPDSDLNTASESDFTCHRNSSKYDPNLITSPSVASDSSKAFGLGKNKKSFSTADTSEWGGPQTLNAFLAHSASISTLIYSNNGSRLLSSAVDGSAYVWEFDKVGKIEKRIYVGVGDPFSEINGIRTDENANQNPVDQAVSDQNLAQDSAGSAQADPNENSIALSQGLAPIEANQVGWVCDDSIVLVSNSVGVVSAFDSASGEKLWSHRGHGNMEVFVLETHPTDPRIAFSGGYNGTVVLWDVKTGNILQRFTIDEQIFDGSFSEDGKLFAVAGETGAAYLFGNAENEKQYRDARRMPEQMFASDYTRTVHDAEYFVIDEISQVAPHLMNHGPLYDFDGRQYRIQKGNKFGMDIEYGLNNALLEFKDQRRLNHLYQELQHVGLLLKHVSSQPHKAGMARQVNRNQGDSSNTVGADVADTARSQPISSTTINSAGRNNTRGNGNESEDDVELVISEDENENIIVHQYRRGGARPNQASRVNNRQRNSLATNSYVPDTDPRAGTISNRSANQSRRRRPGRSRQRGRRNRNNNRRGRSARYDEDSLDSGGTSLEEFVLNDDEEEYFDDGAEEEEEEELDDFEIEMLEQRDYSRALRSGRPLTRAQVRPSRSDRARQTSRNQNTFDEEVRGATRAQTNLNRSGAVNRRDPATRRSVLESLRRRRQERNTELRNTSHLSGEESSLYVSNTRNNNNSTSPRLLRRPRMNLRSMDTQSTRAAQEPQPQSRRRAGLRSDTSTRANYNRSIISDESSDGHSVLESSRTQQTVSSEVLDGGDGDDFELPTSSKISKNSVSSSSTQEASKKRPRSGRADATSPSEGENSELSFREGHRPNSYSQAGLSKSKTKKTRVSMDSSTPVLRSRSALSTSSGTLSTPTPPQTTRSGRLIKRSWKLEQSESETPSRRSSDLTGTSTSSACIKTRSRYRCSTVDRSSPDSISNHEESSRSSRSEPNSVSPSFGIPKTIKLKFSSGRKTENGVKAKNRARLTQNEAYKGEETPSKVQNSIVHAESSFSSSASYNAMSPEADPYYQHSRKNLDMSSRNLISQPINSELSDAHKPGYSNKRLNFKFLEPPGKSSDSTDKSDLDDLSKSTFSEKQLLSWTTRVEPLEYSYKPQVGDEIVYFDISNETTSLNPSTTTTSNRPPLQSCVLGKIADLEYKVSSLNPRELSCNVSIQKVNLKSTTSFRLIEFIKEHENLDSIGFLPKKSFNVSVFETIHHNMVLYSRLRESMLYISNKKLSFELNSKVWMILPNDTTQLCNFDGIVDDNGDIVDYDEQASYLLENPFKRVTCSLFLSNHSTNSNNLPEQLDSNQVYHLSIWEIAPEANLDLLRNVKYEQYISGSSKTKAKLIISKLIGNENYEWFKTNVDFQEYPDYLSMIAYPICFDFINNRVSNDYYRQLSSFHKDVYQIYQNAITYNDSDSDVYDSAIEMINTYVQMIKDNNLEIAEWLVSFGHPHNLKAPKTAPAKGRSSLSDSRKLDSFGIGSSLNHDSSPSDGRLRQRKAISYNDEYESSDYFEAQAHKTDKSTRKSAESTSSTIKVKVPGYRIETDEDIDSSSDSDFISRKGGEFKRDPLTKKGVSPSTSTKSLRKSGPQAAGSKVPTNKTGTKSPSPKSKNAGTLERKSSLRRTPKKDYKIDYSSSSFNFNGSDFENSELQFSDDENISSSKGTRPQKLTNRNGTNSDMVKPEYSPRKRKARARTTNNLSKSNKKKKSTRNQNSRIADSDSFESSQESTSDASSSSFHP